MLALRSGLTLYAGAMKFTVYRARERFVVSPDCMQAPIAVQTTHRAVCVCGSFDLPTESMPNVASAVLDEGFAIVGKRDQLYAVMDRLCTQRSGYGR